MQRLRIAFPYLLMFAMAVLVVWSNLRGGPPESMDVARESSPAPADSNVCPPCGMTVAEGEGHAAEIEGHTQWFCSNGCKNSYLAGQSGSLATPQDGAHAATGTERLFDLVCQMEVNPAWGFVHELDGTEYFFCTDRCRVSFADEPNRYLGERCMVCRTSIEPSHGFPATYMERTYFLCSAEHRTTFKADPAGFFLHRMWGIPDWLYYVSIALLLVVSFLMMEGRQSLRRLWQRSKEESEESKSTDFTPRWNSPTRLAFATSYGSGTETGSAAVADLAQSHAAAGIADRIDLMRVGVVRKLLLSRPFRFLMQLVMVAFFLLIIGAGLFGNQNPALNVAPLLTWTIWWCGLVVLIMFAGKAWCYMCPWDALATWMEKLRFWKKEDRGLGLDLRWPRAVRNIAVAIALFIVLTWVELGFGVTMRPRVTAYLAIAMLLLAIVSAFLFDRKSFCRYGCLVGRISGLYALFSGVEVRSRDAGVCSSCKTKECVNGSETAYGCPTFEHPAKMNLNTYCIQCAECLQACPHDNLAVNLRPWGADLAVEGKPRTDEAYLALLMLSITGFHGLTMTPVWKSSVEAIQNALPLGEIAAFSAGMTGLLALPILIYAVLVWFSHRLSVRPSNPVTYMDYFIRYSYCVLPIALFYHLAHNLEHLLMEGPKVFALLSDPFGWGWNLFGTASLRIPPLVSLDVLWLVQVTLVGVGHIYSLWVAQKISRRLFVDEAAAFRGQLPMLIGMIAFSVFSLWLLKLPMEMRTSAM